MKLDGFTSPTNAAAAEGGVMMPAPDTAHKKTVLIVEDNDMNREILMTLLEEDYKLLTAVNGQEGLQVLEQHGREVSAVLLDIEMPIWTGYDFLEHKNLNKDLDGVPVIVTSANDTIADEIRALHLGANDFVKKPYNGEVIKNRLANVIRLRETSALLGDVETDRSGLYTAGFFRRYAREYIETHDAEGLYLAVTVVEEYNAVLELFGIEAADKLCIWAAECLRAQLDSYVMGGSAGRGTILLLLDAKADAGPSTFYSLDLANDSLLSKITLKMGYKAVDPDMNVQVQLGYASMALTRARDVYGNAKAEFVEEMARELVHRQDILNSAETALATGQFVPYFQPKHGLASDKTEGAEALVRWIHPDLGFMSPGLFVPLFEQDGFITKVDLCIWRQVCQAQRRWLDEGVPVVPVSVNVSRRDFQDTQIVEKIIALVDEYQLPHDLIHLEVTESVCDVQGVDVVSCINRLHDAGFAIELDDFGSGYSSLAMLNHAKFDVMKLDMTLVRQEDSGSRDSVTGMSVRMADMLGMKTVAEGVETAEKVEEMRALGCDYIQGYYYSKPLPMDEFEQYLRDNA